MEVDRMEKGVGRASRSEVAVPPASDDSLDPVGLVGEDWIDSRVYSDPQIFRTEMDHVLAASWVCIGYDSEMAGRCSYKAATVAGRPVLAVRSEDGELNVFYNRCRHRGVRLLEPGCGSLRRIVCPYHGWSYDTSGRLRGVPYSDAYRGVSTFQRDDLALTPVARVDVYAGLVFVSLAKDVPDLPDYLGHARRYLDRFFTEGEMVLSGRSRLGYQGNWKLQMENVVDNYHLGFLHQTWLDIIGRRYSVNPGSLAGDSDTRSWSFPNGHGAIDFHRDGPAAAPRETAGVTPFNVIVFPTLCLAADHTIILVTPIAPDRTQVELMHMVPADTSDRERAALIRRQEDFYGPFGFVMTDDFEVAFRRVTEGIRADLEDRRVWFNRGIAREVIEPDGRRWSQVTDEGPQRGFYRQWSAMMADAR